MKSCLDMMITSDVCLILFYSIVLLLSEVLTTIACDYITSEHHLPLSSDWPSAGKYGGYAI